MSRQHHNLKIDPEYYRAIEKDLKHFEVRKKDRDYHVGDILHLLEYAGEKYTGREILAGVTYILDNPDYCKEGFVVMSIKVIYINS